MSTILSFTSIAFSKKSSKWNEAWESQNIFLFTLFQNRFDCTQREIRASHILIKISAEK